MVTSDNLRPANPADLERALAHALQFDGRRQFKTSGEMMAKITAAHLAEQLRVAGFVVMQRPAAAHYTAPSTGPDISTARDSGGWWGRRLRDVLPRLRCKVCRGWPRRAALVASPAGEAAGRPPPGWVISLE